MKIYEANNKLESILLNEGFIETTSERDKNKGKKSFKISNPTKIEINTKNNLIDIYVMQD